LNEWEEVVTGRRRDFERRPPEEEEEERKHLMVREEAAIEKQIRVCLLAGEDCLFASREIGGQRSTIYLRIPTWVSCKLLLSE